MDVLTDLLNEMYLSGEVVARFDLTAPWGINMPPHGGIFHAIDQGDCWVRLAPDGELFRVSAGDLVIFPEGASHDLVDAPSSLAIPLQDALCGLEPNSLVCPVGDPGGSGPKTRVVCGIFHFKDSGFHALRSMLPPVLHIRGDQGENSQWLQMTVHRLSEETAATTPGAYTIMSRMTDILFIEGIRVWLKSEEAQTTGWLRVLNDPVVGRALELIHGEPGRTWTVASLAAEVGLSRSAFAAHFTTLMGVAPLRYITCWRMQLASNWLRANGLGIREIAERLGYASEDAFNRAFRREVGVAPGAYRRQSQAGQLTA